MRRTLLLVCVTTALVTCEYNGSYYGLLTTECVKRYDRIYVTRDVPPRYYQYFHEAPLAEFEDQDQTEVEVRFRIVGGNQVSIEQVPYSVLYGLYCGGVLIAPDWVLTAAHCKVNEKYVYAGSTQRSKAIRYGVCAHFIHPLWDSLDVHNHDYDYQLVLLESAVPVSARARPIAIAGAGDVRPGEMVAISGWGHTKHKEKMQDNIRRVSIPILDSEMCRALPSREYRAISPRMFCAGYLNGTKDSCQGDSGGPAIAHGKLMGLVSFGIGCASANQPGVYANVPAARDWIRQITALPL